MTTNELPAVPGGEVIVYESPDAEATTKDFLGVRPEGKRSAFPPRSLSRDGKKGIYGMRTAAPVRRPSRKSVSAALASARG